MKIDKDRSDKLRLALRRARAAQWFARRERIQYEQLQFAMAENDKFSLAINASSSTDEILSKVMKYLGKGFHIETAFLALVDKENNELFVLKAGPIPSHFTKQMENYVKTLRIPLDQSSGMVFKIYKRRRAFYLADADIRFWNRIESEIVRKLKIHSFLILPLVAQNEVFALAFFTSFHQKMILRKSDLDTITRISNQVASLIRNSYLLERIQYEKQQSEQSKREIKRLNDFSKEVHSLRNIDEIMDRLFFYVRNLYPIDGGLLFLQCPNSNEEIYINHATEIEYLADDVVELVEQFRLPQNKNAGIFFEVWQKKRPLYINQVLLSMEQELLRPLLVSLKISSLLLVPINIHNKPLGIVAFYSHTDDLNLSQENINTIKGFSDQIPGAVQSSLLLAEVEKEKEKSDQLLHAILPGRIADLLKSGQKVVPRFHPEVSVMFTDFAGFTKISEKLTPNDLLDSLNYWFEKFDEACEAFNVTRIKTIGDGYMAASGLLGYRKSHAVDMALAAWRLLQVLEKFKQESEKSNLEYWYLRIGLHCGPVLSGIIGSAGYQFDIWGDTVNIASRMESSGEIGAINVSEQFYVAIKDFFVCEERGLIQAKQKGNMPMYFLRSIRPEFTEEGVGLKLNDAFRQKYFEKFGHKLYY